MKIKPILENRINTVHTSYVVDFYLESNVTFICGDSGTGKSAVFSFLQELATEKKQMRCFNYLDIKKNYKSIIKRSIKKLFVIDNADVLLDDDMRNYIAFDSNNQYIIIGRNPSGLMLAQDEFYELVSNTQGNKTYFMLKKVFG